MISRRRFLSIAALGIPTGAAAVALTAPPAPAAFEAPTMQEMLYGEAREPAFMRIRQEILDDPMYAWTWQCNVAGAFQMALPALTDWEVNCAAAELMMLFFDVDMRKNEYWDNDRTDGIRTPLELRAKRLADLKNIEDIQRTPGNYDYSPYMMGLANGIIIARSVIEGHEPDFMDAPTRWRSDKTAGGTEHEPPLQDRPRKPIST